VLCEQVRQAKKAEVQGQKKAEKAAREAAEREKDLRSYKHIMQVRLVTPGAVMRVYNPCHLTAQKNMS
jgi:DNA-binding TFAR19-related protein (PDSD5 family)